MNSGSPGGLRLVALLPHEDPETGPLRAPIAALAALAAENGTGFDVLFVGGDVDDTKLELAHELGAGIVWVASHRELGKAPGVGRQLQACEQALGQIGLAENPHAVVLLPAGPPCEEIAARLATRFDGVALGRCLEIHGVEGALVVRRAAYGGRAHLELRARNGPCFGTIRKAPPIAEPSALRGRGAPKGNVGIELTAPLSADQRVRSEDAVGRELPLEGARIVVSGGRGMRSEEGFALLRELADVIGAAVGGSLPAVDAGWVPVSRQIGQSGKYVTPRLYVAIGISGTPQHLAGIGPEVRIVAINSDAEAEIFRVAEVGAVADWNELLPPLIARLRAAVAANVEARATGAAREDRDAA